MTANAGELSALRAVSAALGPLRTEVVFVGGMIRSLLITDPAAPMARPTDDIDLVAAISSRAEYYVLAERLRELGFREDRRDKAPLCRWIVRGLTVDVMPDHENVLGFSNRWYHSAGKTATVHTIGREDSDRIRVVNAPHFVATKITSFQNRGKGDFCHHDMEDIVAVVDGREELLAEHGEAPAALRSFVATEIGTLLKNDSFIEPLPGHLPGDKASQARLPLLHRRLTDIAGRTK